MNNLNTTLEAIQDLIWGPPLLALILGVGIYFTFLLRGMQFRYLGYAIKQVFAPQKKNAKGDISHFEALMTSLAGAIGTGSIVGVATGIAIGGMGSIFWMWVTALFGMATKYAESLLAVKYRHVDERGEMIGGPMQYIEKGLGWKWMAFLFALFGAIAAIGTGNLVQVNAISESVSLAWEMNPWVTGCLLAFITGCATIGGVKSIGYVAGVLVPIMALFYLIGGLLIIGQNYLLIPGALKLMVTSAFTGQAAMGGFAGASVMMALQSGVSRSIFSNESGLGISSIAAAAAKTDSPGRQAMITMTGALLSTVIICTITGLVLAVSGVLGTEKGGATMAIRAFDASLPHGRYIVIVGLILFAYSTIIAWAYYGEKCYEYLFGERTIPFYRFLFIAVIIPGAAIEVETAWHIANICNGLMVIPNLLALIALSSVIVAETKHFLRLVATES